MYKATKRNRQVTIQAAQVKYYESLGYSIKDEDGKTVFEPEDPVKEAAALRIENKALKAENEALKAEIEELKGDRKNTAKKAAKEAE